MSELTKKKGNENTLKKHKRAQCSIERKHKKVITKTTKYMINKIKEALETLMITLKCYKWKKEL